MLFISHPNSLASDCRQFISSSVDDAHKNSNCVCELFYPKICFQKNYFVPPVSLCFYKMTFVFLLEKYTSISKVIDYVMMRSGMNYDERRDLDLLVIKYFLI